MTSGMTKTKLASALLTLLLLLPTLASGEENHSTTWNTATLLNLLATVTSRQSVFTEEKTLDYLEEPLVQKGTLYFTAPSQLIKHITEPREEVYTIIGANLKVEISGKPEQLLRTDDHPILHAFIESQRAVLAGDLNALEQYYSLVLDGVREQWTLQLHPKESELSSRLKLISIKGSGTEILKMQIIEIGGDDTLLTFRSNKTSRKLKTSRAAR